MEFLLPSQVGQSSLQGNVRAIHGCRGTVTYTIVMSTDLPLLVLVMRTRRPHSWECSEDYDTGVN